MVDKRVKDRFFLKKYRKDVYLTKREADVLVKLMEGLTVRETAAYYELSARTAEFYLKNMKVKFNCKSKNELVYLANDADFLEEYARGGSA